MSLIVVYTNIQHILLSEIESNILDARQLNENKFYAETKKYAVLNWFLRIIRLTDHRRKRYFADRCNILSTMYRNMFVCVRIHVSLKAREKSFRCCCVWQEQQHMLTYLIHKSKCDIVTMCSTCKNIKCVSFMVCLGNIN